jgi:hypothetical protein
MAYSINNEFILERHFPRRTGTHQTLFELEAAGICFHKPFQISKLDKQDDSLDRTLPTRYFIPTSKPKTLLRRTSSKSPGPKPKTSEPCHRGQTTEGTLDCNP